MQFGLTSTIDDGGVDGNNVDVGLKDGVKLGRQEGKNEGDDEGSTLGIADGIADGISEGFMVGVEDGFAEGRTDGVPVRAKEGDAVGTVVGEKVIDKSGDGEVGIMVGKVEGIGEEFLPGLVKICEVGVVEGEDENALSRLGSMLGLEENSTLGNIVGLMDFG